MGNERTRTLARARKNIRRIAEGATISGTYKLPPGEGLDAFRSDLIALLDDKEN